MIEETAQDRALDLAGGAVPDGPAGLFATAPGTAPTFFIVGAMKAGTTLLASLLRGHPAVHVAPIKEPTFFCGDLNARPPVTPMPEPPTAAMIARHQAVSSAELAHFAILHDPAAYRALFATAAIRPARGECSTAYLYSEVAAAAIAGALPQARIIIVLRNPIRRAFSEYLMNRSIGRTTLPFMAALEAEPRAAPIVHGAPLYVRASRYADQVERFLTQFPAAQVEILLFEELVADLEGGFGRLCDGLGVPRPAALPTAREQNSAMVSRFEGLNRLLYSSSAKELIGRAVPRGLKELGKRLYYRKQPPETMSGAAEAFLRQALVADVRRLERLIGRDLAGIWGL